MLNADVRLFSGVISANCKQLDMHIMVIGPVEDAAQIESIFDTPPLSSMPYRGIIDINRKLHAIAVNRPEALVFFVSAEMCFSAADLISLAEILEADPLYGFVQPLVAPKGLLEELSRIYEHLPMHERRIPTGVPLLLKATIFRDFGFLDEQAEDFDSALVQLFIRSNRRGVSACQANRVFMLVNINFTGMKKELRLNRARDYAKAESSQMTLPEVQFERLVKHRFSSRPVREIVFDIRNLAPGFNGTSRHILSLLGPLHHLVKERGMRLYFLVLPASAEFHGLNLQYPKAIIHELKSEQCFDASIRLTQPWSLTEIRDQAYVSTVNVVSILDTIGWDCHYIRMPHLDGVWRSMAEYTDGFVFISAFTRARFFERFPQSVNADHVVAHCSMTPAEYLSAQDWAQAQVVHDENSYVLMLGNKYYHKGLTETVRILSIAFPDVCFKVLGEFQGSFHNVEQIVSGAQNPEDVALLFAGCSCLVFPSFYEGFGLPIFEALALGKPVLARDSELIQELKENIRPVCGLHSYSSNNGLLRGLKALLQSDARDCSVEDVVPQAPYRWEDSAREILDLVDRLLNANDLDRCRKRLDFFYRIEMFDVERAGWASSSQNMVSFEVEKEE